MWPHGSASSAFNGEPGIVGRRSFAAEATVSTLAAVIDGSAGRRLCNVVITTGGMMRRSGTEAARAIGPQMYSLCLCVKLKPVHPSVRAGLAAADS